VCVSLQLYNPRGLLLIKAGHESGEFPVHIPEHIQAPFEVFSYEKRALYIISVACVSVMRIVIVACIIVMSCVQCACSMYAHQDGPSNRAFDGYKHLLAFQSTACTDH
jgi:hypothetical protein